MEALTSVSIAALTIYDMCKGNNRNQLIINQFIISNSRAPDPISLLILELFNTVVCEQLTRLTSAQ